MGNATLTRISSKLPVARSLPRPSKDSGWRSPKTSDVTECQTTSYRDPTCGEVCLRYCVRVLRPSHLQCVPFCRTCGVNGTRAALFWLYFYTVSDVKRRNFSRAVKSFVEEPHQLLTCLSTQHMIMFLRCSRSRVRSCHHPMKQDVALHISLSVVALPTLG